VFWKETPEALELDERLLPSNDTEEAGLPAAGALAAGRPTAAASGAEPSGAGALGALLAGAPTRARTVAVFAPIMGLAAITVLLGLVAEPALRLTARAAAQLADPSGYVRAVLGDAP
jgi:multicomponent Na+:H+ antiporter subunit D